MRSLKVAMVPMKPNASLEEAATEKSEAAPRRDLGAVNWADIGVRDVEYRLSMIGPVAEPYCFVLVEEAEPHGRFAQWLNERIDSVRFPNTYVECEW
jgi:hypothetical protein